MERKIFNIRMDLTTRERLVTLAREDNRTLANMVEKLVTDEWARRQRRKATRAAKKQGDNADE